MVKYDHAGISSFFNEHLREGYSYSFETGIEVTVSQIFEGSPKDLLRTTHIPYFVEASSVSTAARLPEALAELENFSLQLRPLVLLGE